MDENNQKSEQVNEEVHSSTMDDTTARERSEAAVAAAKEKAKAAEPQAEPVRERIIEKTTIIKEVPVNKGVNRVVYILLAFFLWHDRNSSILCGACFCRGMLSSLLHNWMEPNMVYRNWFHYIGYRTAILLV